MTGRRLYEHFTDAKAGTIRRIPPGDTSNFRSPPPVAWSYLPRVERQMWSDLAKRVTPKPRPKPKPAPAQVWLTARDRERAIHAIKEFRAVTRMGLRECKDVSDRVHAGTPFKLTLPEGLTVDAARQHLAHWTVLDA